MEFYPQVQALFSHSLRLINFFELGFWCFRKLIQFHNLCISVFSYCFELFSIALFLFYKLSRWFSLMLPLISLSEILPECLYSCYMSWGTKTTGFQNMKSINSNMKKITNLKNNNNPCHVGPTMPMIVCFIWLFCWKQIFHQKQIHLHSFVFFIFHYCNVSIDRHFHLDQ